MDKREIKQRVAFSPSSFSAQVAQATQTAQVVQEPVQKSVPSPQKPQPLVSSFQPIQRSLLRDVVEGETSSETFKIVLQKTPEPWAQNLLTKLAPIIDDMKNYSQLEELFVLSIPPERHSILERIKTMLRSPSPISKMREYKGWMGSIQKSLHDRDIKNALYYFNKLSPQEKSQLKTWNEYAQRLLKFETIMKTDTVSENQEQKTLQTENKLIAFALLKGVMEELFSPKALMAFLQKTPEPWAQSLSTKLTPVIKDAGSYPKLEEILVAFNPLERVKKPIHIRKMDKRGEYEDVAIEDIQKALHKHDLQKALDYYKELSPKEKTLLKSWVDYAKRLQILDAEVKKLYLEIMEGLNE